MNQLLERILEVPPRQRILLLVGSLAFLFLAYAYFIYLPRSAAIAHKEETQDGLRKERDRKAALAADLDHARAEVAKLNGDLRAAIAQLPDTKEIPDLLSNISSLGRESGLEIIQFKQRPEQLEDFYAAVPVDILVRGTYNQVETFFDKVSRLARIVNVTNVAIKDAAQPQGGTVALDTSCAAVTFRFLDESERERVAKQKEKEKEKGGKR
jgi:type IV pilus assembly protein PilO